MATATMKDARITARVMAQHRHLDTQIENLERKNFHNRELIIDLKKQKLKIKDRLATISLREERQSKKELESRYKNIQSIYLINKKTTIGRVILCYIRLVIL